MYDYNYLYRYRSNRCQRVINKSYLEDYKRAEPFSHIVFSLCSIRSL
jgi:hypothetical protein